MLSLALMLLPSPALACGGMFCDTSTATTIVVQAAERIVFSFNEGMLDTEVQIAFQGEADEFAWVVPVPVEPELYVSNDALFTVLGEATAPQYVVNTQFTGAPQDDGCNGISDTASADGSGEDGGSVGVTVAATETVGPYDTVVLQATNADVLVTWLQDQGYSLPDTLSTRLEPYVAAGQYFVALKLSSDKGTGDLTPLGMRYAASVASIPIQLTAVAAVPDLPIEVFVLGPARAVPDNYLHVQLNDAALDWFGGLANYTDVVSRAVDEAGGQAFVTEFAGPASELGVPDPVEPLNDVPAVVWDEEWLDLRAMAEEDRPVWWVGAIASSPLPVSAQLLTLIVRYVPPPEGVSAEELYGRERDDG